MRTERWSSARHCGAPQVQLSEELKERAELRAANLAAGDARTPSDAFAASERSLVWRDALRFAALAAGVAAVLGLLSALAGPVLLLGWLWAVVSPIVVLGFFHGRTPEVPITTGFGARLGLATGIAVGSTMIAIYALDAFIARRLHLMGDFDAGMQNARAQAMSQSGSAYATQGPQIAQWMTVPEFRAGSMLATAGFALLVLIVLTTAGGAFAGYARSRKS